MRILTEGFPFPTKSKPRGTERETLSKSVVRDRHLCLKNFKHAKKHPRLEFKNNDITWGNDIFSSVAGLIAERKIQNSHLFILYNEIKKSEKFENFTPPNPKFLRICSNTPIIKIFTPHVKNRTPRHWKYLIRFIREKDTKFQETKLMLSYIKYLRCVKFPIKR